VSRTEHFEIFERTKSGAEHAQHIYSRWNQSILKLKRGRSYTILLDSVKFDNRIKLGVLVYFCFSWDGRWAGERCCSWPIKWFLRRLSLFNFGRMQQHKQLINGWTLGVHGRILWIQDLVSHVSYLVLEGCHTHLRALNSISVRANVILNIFVSGLHKLWQKAELVCVTSSYERMFPRTWRLILFPFLNWF